MPFALELQDQLADLLRFLGAEGRGRLVHDQHAGVEVDGARDRDRLALAARERAHRRLEVAEVGIEARHHLARGRLHGVIVERAPGAAHLAAEKQIGGGVEIVGKRQCLIDRLDAVALGVARALRISTGWPSIRISPASGR